MLILKDKLLSLDILKLDAITFIPYDKKLARRMEWRFGIKQLSRLSTIKVNFTQI